MVLTKEQKKTIVEDLAGRLSAAKSVVFSDYQGVSANAVQKLREELREQAVEHKVVKITLLTRALARAGIDISRFDFQVPVAVTFSQRDEVAPAKILSEFAKKHEALVVLGGVLDSQPIGVDQVEALAALPTMNELRAQVLRAINGPLTGLAGVLSGNLRSLVYALKAVEATKS